MTVQVKKTSGLVELRNDKGALLVKLTKAQARSLADVLMAAARV